MTLFKLSFTYLQPTHYFSLARKQKGSIFPKIEDLPKDIKIFRKRQKSYESKIASNYDLSWQAIQKGYIGDAPTYATLRTTSSS